MVAMVMMRGSGPRVLLLLVLVFLAGAAGGVAVDRLWLAPTSATAADAGEGRDGDRDRDRDRRATVIERFAEELGLTAEQRSRIDTIVEHHRSRIHELWSDFRPRYRAAVDSARTEIESVLEPEQVEHYRKLLRKRDDDSYGDRNGKKEGAKVKSGKSERGDGERPRDGEGGR